MELRVTLAVLLLANSWVALHCANVTGSSNETKIAVKSLCDREIAFAELCHQTNCNQNASCNMHCTVNSAMNTMKIKRCSQSCSKHYCPANMTCHVPDECMQNCNGFCDQTMMKCNKSSSCTQVCNKGCPKMQCMSPRCTQECDNGDCVMECTKDVKKCIQNCKHGSCKMVCDASTCEQDCNEEAKCTIIRRGERIVATVEHKTTTKMFEDTDDVQATEPTPSNIGPIFYTSPLFMLNFILLKLAF